MVLLSIKDLVVKRNDVAVLGPVDLLLHEGEKLAIAGETGSGKTSLLKAIAGLLQPAAGSIQFKGERVLGADEKLLPGHPQIAFLSQHFELHNNYRVEELLEYANKLPETEAMKLFRLCRIDRLLKRRTDQLSGGERQRIVLAKQLITSPQLLLLDEPFSNLDRPHKILLKEVISDISRQLGITSVLVSHDPSDILSWADRIIILQEGKIIQDADPVELFHRPLNEYAATLLGDCQLIEKDVAIDLLRGRDPGEKKLLVRSSWFEWSTDAGSVGGTVVGKEYGGSFELVLVQCGQQLIRVTTPVGAINIGETICLTLPAERVHLIEASSK